MTSVKNFVGNLPACPDELVVLRNAAGDSVAVSLYGGQILSWRTAEGCERLYCTPQAVRTPGHAVRGGVPVCFPQFANRGPLAKHGFARTSLWHVAAAPDVNHATGVVSVCLVLKDDVQSRAFWPHGFQLELRVRLGRGWLEIALKVLNTGESAFEFMAALHTYLAVADVRDAALVGLKQASYIDSLKQLDEHNREVVFSQESTSLRIAGELDRIYLNTPGELQLVSSEKSCLRIMQTGFCDTVVWNPGPIKAAALGDMPVADYTKMLCVEAAQIGRPVKLESGEQWCGVQTLATGVGRT